MRNALLASVLLTGLLGLGTGAAFAAGEEVQGIKVNKGNGNSGDGNTINMKGNPLPLSGQALKVGDPLPSAMVTAGNLGPVDIATGNGKVRIISVVPSVDTPTCEAQTHQLSEKDRKLADQVEMITISMDLPFAQQRFAKEAKIKNITFYSDYKSGQYRQEQRLDDRSAAPAGTGGHRDRQEQHRALHAGRAGSHRTSRHGSGNECGKGSALIPAPPN